MPHLLNEDQKTARVSWYRKTLRRLNRGDSNDILGYNVSDPAYLRFTTGPRPPVRTIAVDVIVTHQLDVRLAAGLQLARQPPHVVVQARRVPLQQRHARRVPPAHFL